MKFDDKSTLVRVLVRVLLSGNKPMSKSLFGQLCRHVASLGYNELMLQIRACTND